LDAAHVVKGRTKAGSRACLPMLRLPACPSPFGVVDARWVQNLRGLKQGENGYRPPFRVAPRPCKPLGTLPPESGLPGSYRRMLKERVGLPQPGSSFPLPSPPVAPGSLSIPCPLTVRASSSSFGGVLLGWIRSCGEQLREVPSPDLLRSVPCAS